MVADDISGPFYLHGLTLISEGLSNYTYALQSVERNHLSIPKRQRCYGATVEVWECISNFIALFIEHVITYPCLD